MTSQELESLRQAIVNGISEGFKSLPKYDSNGRNISDNTDPNNNPIDKNARNNYIKNMSNAQIGDKKNEIERNITHIRRGIKRGNFFNNRYRRKKIKEQENELERLENGGLSRKDQLEYNAKTLSAGINVITQIGGALIDAYMAFGMRKIDLSRAYLEYNSKMIKINLERQSLGLINGMKGIAAGFDQNVVEMAYSATQSGYEMAKTGVRTRGEMMVAEKTLSKNVLSTNIAFQQSVVSSAITIGGAIGSTISDTIGNTINAIGRIVKVFISGFSKFTIAEAELEIEKSKITADIMNAYVEKMQKIVEPLDKLYKETSEFVLKLDEGAMKYGVTLGWSGANGRAFSDAIIDMSQKTVNGGITLARLFGEEVEKIPEYLGAYMNASGRNVGMDANDIGNIMGTAKLFGMSGQESANLYGSMNIFNTSISSASESLGVMYHEVTRMGLSNKKYSKDLLQNLKLAQKYNFRGGVENMMRLTKWAQQTRFNLNNATSFADKLLSGSLGGVLETSSKLQALGGAAAMYSDPFKLWYNAGMDVGGLAMQQAAIFNDIGARFDTETGDIDFGWFGNKMINERAKAIGMSPEDARNMIRQNIKQGIIDKEIGDKLSKEDKIAIGNRATYNAKEQKWEVVDIRGEKHDLDYYTSGQGNIEDLLPADTHEAILTVAEKSLSELETLQHAVEHNRTRLGAEKRAEIMEVVKREEKTIEKFYNEHWGGVLRGFKAAKEHSEESFNMEIDMMQTAINNMGTIKNIYSGLQNAARTITKENRDNLYAAAAAFARGGKAYAEWAQELCGFFLFKERPPTDGEWRRRSEETDITQPFWKEMDDLLSNMGIPPSGTPLPETDKKTGDAVGNTGGGLILGINNTKSINDGGINIRSSFKNSYSSSMPEGPIDKIIQQLIPGLEVLTDESEELDSGVSDVECTGTIDITPNGSDINIIELIKNDPSVATKFVSLIQRNIEINRSGKATKNYKI